MYFAGWREGRPLCFTCSGLFSKKQFLLSSTAALDLADIPSYFMLLVGIMVNLCARQGVNRGRGQGNIGPVGPIGFARLGSGLGLLFLPSLSTYTRKRKTTVKRSQKKNKSTLNKNTPGRYRCTLLELLSQRDGPALHRNSIEGQHQVTDPF